MKLKEIAKKHGLTPKGVDYALRQYQTVICEITHGMMSKLSYDAKDIIRTAQERWCDTCELKEQKPTTFEKDGHHIRCTNCGEYWCETDIEGNRFPNEFCPNCGRKNNKENKNGT